jgi:hypothetical protein
VQDGDPLADRATESWVIRLGRSIPSASSSPRSSSVCAPTALAPLDTADALAEHLSLLLEGAMVRAGLEGDTTRLRRARRLAADLLESPGGRGIGDR